MTDLKEFTVQGDGISVFAGSAGASWAILCSGSDCRAARVVGFDGAEHAGRGAVRHLLWHASGSRFCSRCDAGLGPNELGDRCAGGCSDEESPKTYLVWSNDAGSWWGPNGGAYTGDVWSAGRYDEDEARKACGMRTWSQGSPPPEVMVLAPEYARDGFTVEEIRGVPDLMRRRIAEATRRATAVRNGWAAVTSRG